MKLKIMLAALGALGMGFSAQAQTLNRDSKVLVAYYSHSGNTREIANQIKQLTGGDLFEIIPVEDYSEDYSQTTEQAKKEIAEGYKPALKNMPANFSEYDVIFVGSPCWWGTVASPVATFLSENNFSGKTLVPFMTHGGSGFGHSLEDIRKLAPDARLADGKAFWGRSVKSAGEDVKIWLKGLNNG